MKITIIGGNSGLAKRFIDYLSDKNVEILSYDIQAEPSVSNVRYFQIDFSNIEQLNKIDLDSDYIYIFSGLTGPEKSMIFYNEFIDVNIKYLLNICNYLKNNKYKGRLIYPSSRLVYANSDEFLVENSKLEAKSIYGLTKIFAENIIRLYNQLFNLEYTIVRIGIPFDDLGHENNKFGIFSNLVNQCTNTGQVTLYGDGSGKRTFTHINDLCYVLYAISQNDSTANNIYNVGGKIYSLFDIAQALEYKFKCKILFKEWPYESKIVDVKNGMLSSKKLDGLLNIDYIDVMEVINNYE